MKLGKLLSFHLMEFMISNTTGNKTHFIIIPYSTLSNIGSHQVVYRISQYQIEKNRN